MAVFVFSLLCLIWGSTWIAIKLGLTDIPPLYSASIRFVIAVALLALIARIKGARFPSGLRDWFRLAHPGLYMYGLSYACIYFGETQINSSLAGVLFGSFPLFVALLSHLFLTNEKIRPIAWIGLLLGFGGVVLISYDSLQVSTEMFLASAVTLLGALASAVGLIIHQRTCRNDDIYSSATVQMGFGGILLILSALLFEDPSAVHISARVIFATLYLALFGSIVGFLGYYWLLKRMKTVAVSSMSFVTPLVAILIGVWFFQESLSAFMIAGAACILAGVTLVIRIR